MPKAVSNANPRKRKPKKQPTEENDPSCSDSNIKLIKVLKGELSNTHLNDCNNDFAEFQSSRAPSRKRRRQNHGREDITRNEVSSPAKTSLVTEKLLVEEEKEHSSQGNNAKQGIHLSPRKKVRSNVSRRSNITKDVIEVKGGKITSEQGKGQEVRSSIKATVKIKEAKPSPDEKICQSKSKQLETYQGQRGKNHEDRGEDVIRDGTREKLMPCPCCGKSASEIFPDGQGDINHHALVCLHQKFNSKATVDSNQPGTSREESKIPAENQVIRCQICEKLIDHMNPRKKTEHVNRCIDNATEFYAKWKGKGMQRFHADSNGATTTDDEEEVFCQICHKNISHMNSRRRTQHVNRCIDSTLQDVKAPGSLPQDQPQQKTDVPSCIICGTVLNTHQKRKSHLKKCARENNISTMQLLDMVKKQELSSRDESAVAEKPLRREHQESIRPRNVLSAGPSTKACKPKKNNNDLDEDVQVAMAISASIAEQEEKEMRALGITNENLPEMQDTVSLKGKVTKKKKRGRPAKHKPLNFPLLLTRTSPENHKMWAEKIGAIVESLSQQERDVGKTPLTEKSELAKVYPKSAGEWEVIGQGKERQDEDQTTKPIWQLSRCDILLGNTPFYVNNLKPFVSPQKSSKPRIKRLRFEDSPHGKALPEAEKSDSSSPADDLVCGTITQEAVDALVGLALEDEENTSQGRSLSPSASGFIRANLGDSTNEVPVELTDDITQEQHQLIASFSDLVDSPLLEPLTIKTKDGDSIHAHYFMLLLRCPALIKDVRRLHNDTLPETIHLGDFTKPELLTVMSYLYAADISFPDSHVPQVEEFARRYQMKNLQEICNKRLNKSHRRLLSPSKGREQEKDIHDLIQSIWDGTDEQTALSQTGETSSDSLDEPPNLADLTEIYDQASSQKLRHRDGSITSDNGSSDNGNGMDKMVDEDVDSKDNDEDYNGDRDIDGEDGGGEVSGEERVITRRENRLKKSGESSIDKERVRKVEESGEKEQKFYRDVLLDGNNTDTRNVNKRSCIFGDGELFGHLEEGEERSENGLREGIKCLQRGDKIDIPQSDEALGDTVVRERSVDIVTRSIKEVRAEVTSEDKDARRFESKTEKGCASELRKDLGCILDEAEPTFISQSEVMSSGDSCRQSVKERMGKCRNSTQLLNQETDDYAQGISSQRKKRKRRRKRSGITQPIEMDGLASNSVGSPGRVDTQRNIPEVEKVGSPVFTPRKRGRPTKKSVRREEKEGISTSSESDSIEHAVISAPSDVINQSRCRKQMMVQEEKNSPQKEVSPSETQRKRGRPRKSNVKEKGKTEKLTSSESDDVKQPELVPLIVEFSTPQGCDVVGEIQSYKAGATGEGSPGVIPRKRGRPRKDSTSKKNGEIRSTYSENDNLNQAVTSPMSLSSMPRISSDREFNSNRKVVESPTPVRKKRGSPKKYSVVKTEDRSESKLLNVPKSESPLKSRACENLRNNQDECIGSLKKKENSLQVVKRKPGRPRKSEGVVKDDKSGDPSVVSSCGDIEKRNSISPSVVVDSSLAVPYILQERRWSLRSPRSKEEQEKGKLLPLGKSKSHVTRKKKSMPVRMPFMKLATKKQPITPRRAPSPLSDVEQKYNRINRHRKKSTSSGIVKERKIEKFSGPEIERQISTSLERGDTVTESGKIVNDKGQSESKKTDDLDVSASIFGNGDVSEIEVTPKGERNKNCSDSCAGAEKSNSFVSDNYKASEKNKFVASTPNDYLKYKDTISPLKVNLGQKLAVLHMRSVNSTDAEIELVSDINSSKGKENMPEVTDGDHLSVVRMDKTLSFDDNDSDDENGDGIMPVVSPVHFSPSMISGTPSPASSPIFNSSSANQEHRRLKKFSQNIIDETGGGSLRECQEIHVEEIKPYILPREEIPGVIPCKSLNDSLSSADGLCIGCGNDEELVSRSLSSQPIVSLSRKILDTSVKVGKNLKDGTPLKSDVDDEEMKRNEEGIQSVVGNSSKENDKGDESKRNASNKEEEMEVPHGIDKTEDFAFDLEAENLDESLHLSQEEGIRTSMRTSSGTSSSSLGQPGNTLSPTLSENKAEHRNDDGVVDLTEDEEEENDCTIKSVVLDKIDLTDDEAIDLTDDEDVREDADSSSARNPISVLVTNGVDVQKSSEEGTTNLCHQLVNGDDHAGETWTLPLIEGCSHSFMEDLAAAPSDEQFWSDRELGMLPSTEPDTAQRNQIESTFPSDQPAAQILNARSITLEEFCSPAPITPMPPYDEMVTPQLTAELGKFGVKKLKRKQARLKLKELYHYTHQVMQEDESLDETTDDSSKQKQVKELGKSKGAKLTGKAPRRKKNSTKPPEVSKEGSKSSSPSKHKANTDTNFVQPREVSKLKSGGKPDAEKIKRGKGNKNMQPKRVISQEHSEAEKMDTDFSNSQSSGSEERDDFGESIVYDEELDDIPPSQSTSDPDDAIRKYIWNNHEFYQKCLQFQPFDLDEFQSELKTIDIKVSKPRLMAILDAQCLTFRHKSRNRRSPKKKKK